MTRSPIVGDQLLAVLLALVVWTLGSVAAAQGSSDEALAQALFDDGRALMDEGRYDEGCPKLVESFRLAPGGGTLLNVALCHEKQGKLATAWSEYKNALAMARREGKAGRVKFATEHIAAVAPRLNRLTIELAPDADVPNLAISHNGTRLSKAVIGTGLPVDGGEHELIASAAGYTSWRTSFSLAPEGEVKRVTIPLLDKAQATSAAPRPRPEPEPDSAAPTGDGITQRTAGYIVGAVGGAAVIVGVVFGVHAIARQGEADDKCNDSEECPNTPDGMEGLAANEDARTSATAANALIATGLALVGVGLVVVLTAPSGEADEQASVSAVVRPRGVGLRLRW